MIGRVIPLGLPRITRRAAVATAVLLTTIIIVSLLMTRQILPYNNSSASLMFILLISIGYGLCSWILLGYASQAGSSLRARSRFFRIVHISVIIAQFFLLAVLLLILFTGTTKYLSTLVYALSSGAATFFMVSIGIRFLSWYRLSNKNYTILLLGLAAIGLAVTIANDAGSKLLLVKAIEEPTPPGTVSVEEFVYKPDPKYHGDVQYRVVNPDTTTTYVIPDSAKTLYRAINYVSILTHLLPWASTLVLLRRYYQRIGKLSLKFWIVLTIPLISFLIGSNLIFNTPADSPYVYYYRILFRAGTITTSLLFGLAFYLITRNVKGTDVTSTKIKDYLTLSAIGTVMIGLSFSTSALQQTFGIAAHSLVLLASYFYIMGFFASAISISQDISFRCSVRKFASDLVDIGMAQMETDFNTKIKKLLKDNQKKIKEETGIHPPLTDDEVLEQVKLVKEEINHLALSKDRGRISDSAAH